jgi:hypothetical protein
MAAYTSPLRPLDIGYVSRLAGVEIDWSQTDIGPWSRTARYGFAAELPREIVEQFTLKRAD